MQTGENETSVARNYVKILLKNTLQDLHLKQFGLNSYEMTSKRTRHNTARGQKQIVELIQTSSETAS